MLIRAIVLAAGLIATAAVAAESISPCPDPMKGTLRSGVYNFQYHSWSWPSGDYFLFCNCVRNKDSNRTLFVSWEGAVTFIPPGEASWVTNTAPTGREKRKTVPLWYGAGPHPLKVTIVVPDEQLELPFNEFSGLTQYVATTSNTRVATELLPVTTFAHVFVPDLPGDLGNGSLQEVAGLIASSPTSLKPFDMNFSSKIEKDKDGRIISITNSCEYHLRITSSPSPDIAIIFEDKELSHSLFTDGFQRVKAWSAQARNSPFMRPFSGGRDKLNLSPDRITKRQTQMRVVNPSGVVLASVPVAYYVEQNAGN